MKRSTDFGKRIYDARKDAKLTGERLAGLAGLSQSHISKIENGILIPSPKDVRSIAFALHLTNHEAKELVAQADELRDTSWQLKRSLVKDKDRQAELSNLEVRASRIRSFQMYIVPGLLQSHGYMTNFFKLMDDTKKQTATQDAIAARLTRQRILLDQTKRFEFIIMDSALLASFCPPEVIKNQIDHIIAIQTLPNVQIMVKEAALMRCPPTGDFCIFDNTIVTAETLTADVRISEKKEVQEYERHFNRFSQETLEDSEALAFLRKCKRALPRSESRVRSSQG